MKAKVKQLRAYPKTRFVILKESILHLLQASNKTKVCPFGKKDSSGMTLEVFE